MLRRTALSIVMASTFSVAPRISAGDVVPDKLRPVDVEILVRGSLADVWKAWTTNDGVRQWFAPLQRDSLDRCLPAGLLRERSAAHA